MESGLLSKWQGFNVNQSDAPVIMGKPNVAFWNSKTCVNPDSSDVGS